SLAAGVSASVFTISPFRQTCSSTVLFCVAFSTLASPSVVTIQAAGGSPVVTHTATFSLVVNAAFDFSLAATPATLTITAGQAGQVETATATLTSGVTAPVTFSVLTALRSDVHTSVLPSRQHILSCFVLV